MQDKKFLIIGLGEILWDIYGDQKFLGGAPANFAIHCTQLGDIGVALSRIGNDELGEEIIQALSARGIKTEYLQTDSEKPTGTVDVKLDKNGKPHFTCHTCVAFDYLQVTADSESLVQNADALLFGTLAQRNSEARQTIQQLLKSATKTLKVFDINLRGWNDEVKKIVFDSLNFADVVKLNDDEISMLKMQIDPGESDIEFLKKLTSEFNLKLAALTLGERGCILTDGIDVVQEDGIPISVVDTTGCGDAFAAGLVHQLLRGASLKEIARFSNAIGAFVAQFKGATPMYSREDIEKFISKL